MIHLSLEAERRTITGKKTGSIRKTGKIPAVIYGHGVENVSLVVAELPFQKIWRAAGESSLIDLRIDNGSPVKALIQDVQFAPASGKILHIDFHQVNMKEKLEVSVELHFVGEAAAVKELGGTLVKDHDTIEVECLPQDLVKEIDVDLATLKTFDDVIRVSTLKLPKGLELKTDPEAQIAHIEAPRTEAELAELETAVEEDVTKVELEKPTEEPASEEAPQPEK